ncbi:uncharacterized protein LOC123314082 [Coccinella septempunctata]|uniref:uncharacterized protein LOC123314082 n=1 Tax=Coccinella septempunctata TaxID=41139 RepID=UPI001D06ABBD|nr:uncharacterized protein LOC123314082 [Coccinella septempunctata]
MNRADYIVKVETFLSQNNFQELNNNPLNTFIKKAKEHLRICEEFLTEHNKLHILPSNPAIPRLYGLPKIHKLDIPIRPVVSFCNTPVHDLSTFLNSFIKSITDYKPKYSVLNSMDLTHKLRDLEMKDTYIMLSFDVCNLFTSVPRGECIPLVSELLREHDVPDSKLADILTLLKLALSQDFFVFNNVVCRQIDGLAMGSPLSSFLADRFLEKLEAYITIRWRIIVRWYRYVDDIFVILDGVPDDAHALLDFINTLHPRIKFTLELEVNRSINFLDLTISRSEESSLTFEIYRKKTQTDHIIPAQSCHPRSHKMAALRCYVHRALNFPLSQANREKELNIIKQIALNNGYDPEVVDMIKNNVINKQRRALAYSSDVMDNLKYCSLPYMGHLSEAISHVLERSVDGYKISYSGVRSLGSLLVNSKDNVKKLDRSGVYKLKCGDCDTPYVGQTRRKLSTRIKEHLSRPQLL